jgi:tetratricopeptide (TPR) repeat protein
VNTEARNAAIQFNNHGIQVLATGDRQLAYRLLCSATTADPTMAQGWYGLGNAHADLKMLPASIAAFKRCLELPCGPHSGDATPDLHAKAMVNLGHRLLNEGRIDEAEQVSRAAIALLEANPELDVEGRAFAWTNLSMALSIKGEDEEALRVARFAYDLVTPAKPEVELGLGFALLFAGQYREGLKHFEARFPFKLPQYLAWPYERWDGKRIGTLLVEADQGAGDTLSFARFVPEAAARVGRVLFRVQPEILRMMQLAMAPWPNVEIIPQSAIFPIADRWVPIFSLPAALDLTTDQIRACPQRWKPPIAQTAAPTGWKAPSRSLHIGIAYGGSPMNEIDRWRSIPVTEFLALNDCPGVQLYSVQVGDRVQDLHAAGCASHIRDMSPWIRDAVDTVAILQEMDLVIACESFVAHLAASIGKVCWVPLSYRGGDWRCGRSGDRPIWYPKTRLFRQGPDEGWGAVFQRIVGALSENA